MKALIIGSTVCLQNAISMSKGLARLGMEHGYFACKNFVQQYGQEKMKEVLFDAISKTLPNWIFVQYQYLSYIQPEWFWEIKQINPNCRISLMSVDIRNELDKLTIDASQYVDICFQKCKHIDYRKLGVNCHLLQQGYSDLLFYKKDLPKVYDIVFAGSNYTVENFPASGERYELLLYLYYRFPNMKIFGSHWESVFDGQILGGAVKLPEINNIYNSSKLVLNINHYNDIEHYWSIRMIEGMASGTLTLTRYIPGLENYFTNHKNIVWFYSWVDCYDLANYYLSHDEERERIAEQSVIATQRNFKWETIMERAHEMTFGNL